MGNDKSSASTSAVRRGGLSASTSKLGTMSDNAGCARNVGFSRATRAAGSLGNLKNEEQIGRPGGNAGLAAARFPGLQTKGR